MKGVPPVKSPLDEPPTQLVKQQTETYSQSVTQHTQHSQTNSYPQTKTGVNLDKNGGNSSWSSSPIQDGSVLAGKSQIGFSTRQEYKGQGINSPKESDLQVGFNQYK